MQAADSIEKLVRSLREKLVLTGTVTDVVFGAENPEPGIPVGSDYFVITWQDGVEVHVPLDRFSSTDLVQKNQRQSDSTGKITPLATTLRRYLLNRKGSYFDFIVTEIPLGKDDRINGPVIGDRLSAMEIVRHDFWFARAEDGEYVARPGAVFDARVVDVAPESIRVELKGIERILYRDDLVIDEVLTVRESFRVGETIPVEIVKITLRDAAENRVKARLRQDPRSSRNTDHAARVVN